MYKTTMRSILFFCMLTHTLMPLCIHAKQHKHKKQYKHAKQDTHTKSSNSSKEKNCIVLDLTGVLFKENKNEFAKKLGYGTLAHYTFTHWRNPGHTCLDMLNHISTHYSEQKPSTHIKIQKRIMPQCIVDLHKGTKQCPCVKDELLGYIEQMDKTNYFKSKKEKKLMMDMMVLIFNPQETIHLIEPIKPMIDLIKKLKTSDHEIYLFANVPKELAIALQKQYNDTLKLFNGIVISSEINMIKPEETIFQHLFKEHNLTPQHCILIDDQEETCLIAQKLGMQTITYDKPSNVLCALKKHGIIV